MAGAGDHGDGLHAAVARLGGARADWNLPGGAAILPVPGAWDRLGAAL